MLPKSASMENSQYSVERCHVARPGLPDLLLRPPSAAAGKLQPIEQFRGSRFASRSTALPAAAPWRAHRKFPRGYRVSYVPVAVSCLASSRFRLGPAAAF